MKLSKTQRDLLSHIKSTIAEARRYETAEAFYDAINRECNPRWSPAEAAKKHAPLNWQCDKERRERSVQGIVLVSAKTETVNKLEQMGLIEIIERPKRKNGFELVKLLDCGMKYEAIRDIVRPREATP